jgi:hypothetical protein
MIKIHFPFLGSSRPNDFVAAVLGLDQGNHDIWARRFSKLYKEAPNYFCSVSAEEAEVYVYPYRYELNEETIKAGRDARDKGLECVFFTHGDDASAPEVPYGKLYRHSIFADKKGRNEYAMPAFSDDILDNLPSSIASGMLEYRKKTEKPLVGFRGYVGNPFLRTAFRILGRHEKAAGLSLRNQLLKNLASDQGIKTLFEKQNHFSGGKKGITHRDSDFAERVRADYIANILSSDYTLCVRGAGNFSYRLYEVLSAGRIPLFINTKCVLPFEGEINWSKHCVWIESDNIKNISKLLINLHKEIPPNDFREMQINNRRLWEERLSPLGFYCKLFEKLVQKK